MDVGIGLMVANVILLVRRSGVEAALWASLARRSCADFYRGGLVHHADGNFARDMPSVGR